MMRQTVLSSAILLVWFAFDGQVISSFASPAVTQQIDTLELHPRDGTWRGLSIVNPHGSVWIEGYDGPSVVVTSLKRGTIGATAAFRVRVEQSANGELAVRGERQASESADDALAARMDLRIQVPRDVHVDARIRTGTLRATRMTRGVRLHADAGHIEVEDVQGRVDIDSVFAPSQVRQVIGDLDASVLRGELVIDQMTGASLAGTVHDGKVTARHIAVGRVAIRTFRGDVVFEGRSVSGGSVQISSHHGHVTVRLMPVGAIAVRARGQTVSLPGGGVATREGWRFGSTGAAAAVTIYAGKDVNLRFALADTSGPLTEPVGLVILTA